jgi:hypothetical protein
MYLQRLGKALDEIHPFSEKPSVDLVLRDAEKLLSPYCLEVVSAQFASRIWGFVSKFVMVDRFSKALGVAETSRGCQMPKRMNSTDYFGTGAKVCSFIFMSLTFMT